MLYFYKNRAARLFDSDINDADVFIWFVGFGVDFYVGDPLDHLHPFRGPSKHCVLIVQPGGWDDSDEELWAVGSWSCIGHAEGVGSVMSQSGMKLILKLSTPDAFPTHASPCGVSSLDHETLHAET